jgi:hypothetical protein
VAISPRHESITTGNNHSASFRMAQPFVTIANHGIDKPNDGDGDYLVAMAIPASDFQCLIEGLVCFVIEGGIGSHLGLHG